MQTMTSDQSTIRELPEQLVEKIAAGEVIERPASVLKELMENALDARASRIQVTIEDAGFALIGVADDGVGMSVGDLRMCLAPHATSKLRGEQDLFAITTLGFRGEALASIAAVSRLRIVTGTGEEGLGYALESEGGRKGEPGPESRTRGTTVSVRDLFYNVPARKKFMKSRRAERAALVKLVEQLAVVYPAIHFTVTVDGRVVLDTPEVSGPRERIAQIAGHEFASELIHGSGSRAEMDVTVLVSPPRHASARPRYQNVYINLRRADNDQVLYAVREAFSRFVGHGLRPAFFAMLNVDPSRVDVNVHPTKSVVKFEDERMVFGLVHGAVRRALEETLGPGEAQSSSEETAGAPDERSPTPFGPARSSVADVRSADVVSYTPRPSPISPDQTTIAFPSAGGEREKRLEDGSAHTIQLTENLRQSLAGLIQCFQIHELFVLAPIKNGILLIDQHAAHERILYEEALEELKGGSAQSQQLLFPIVIELSPSEKQAIEATTDSLRAVGFEVAEFGTNAVAVSAIPSFMRDADVEEAIRGMLSYLLGDGQVGKPSDPAHRFAAAFACGAAIKRGQKLDQEEMNALINGLFAAQNPYTCPHGRPTVVRISTDELSRRFLR